MLAGAVPVEHATHTDGGRESGLEGTREYGGVPAQRQADAADLSGHDKVQCLQEIHAAHDVPGVLADDGPLRMTSFIKGP
jgi:hypothetical protein